MKFALITTHDGQVIEILKDDFNFFQANAAVIHKVDVYSRGKFLNFIKEVQKQTFLSDWELNILIENELIGVKFTGVYTKENIVLTGSSIKSTEANYLDEFSEMNNQQNTFLREQIKMLQKIQSSQENDWIIENTALKNEVAFLKKELIERNHSNEHLSDDVLNVKNQLSKLKEDYFEVSDEIRSSLQLLQRDYELCVQNNEDQIFEIKDILDRYDQVFEEEI